LAAVGWALLLLVWFVDIEYIAGSEGEALGRVVRIVAASAYAVVIAILVLWPALRAYESKRIRYELWPSELVVERGNLRRVVVRMFLRDLAVIEVAQLPMPLVRLLGDVGSVTLGTVGGLGEGGVRVRLLAVANPRSVADLIKVARGTALATEKQA
jgi:membrane protein YdbS with pleckstrin-like domain